ncbi:MAG TPA: polymerase, partial [Planctomycetaceae bacterium]|nr:polymerase [Planctomycetaceae bacterium]
APVPQAVTAPVTAREQTARKKNAAPRRRQPVPLSIMGGSTAPQNAYILFLLVNITLFLRPAELIPALANLPIYEVLILSSFFLSLDQIKRTVKLPML